MRWIGIYRPFVGGIFGVATFLMLSSGILADAAPGDERDFAYYGTFAFFSGFFERFTKLTTGDVPAIETEGGKADKPDEDCQGSKAT